MIDAALALGDRIARKPAVSARQRRTVGETQVLVRTLPVVPRGIAEAEYWILVWHEGRAHGEERAWGGELSSRRVRELLRLHWRGRSTPLCGTRTSGL